jgi:integrase
MRRRSTPTRRRRPQQLIAGFIPGGNAQRVDNELWKHYRAIGVAFQRADNNPAADFHRVAGQRDAVTHGAHPKVVQRMLGHASAAMTLDVYAELFDSDLDAVAENVAKLWPREA